MAIKLGDEKSLSEEATSGRDFLLRKTRRQITRTISLDEHPVEFKIQGLSSKEFQKVLEAHPPRKNEALDQGMGFNRATLPPALFALSVIEPKLDESEWDEVWSNENYSAGEHANLLDMVLDVSNRGFDVPFGGRG